MSEVPEWIWWTCGGGGVWLLGIGVFWKLWDYNKALAEGHDFMFILCIVAVWPVLIWPWLGFVLADWLVTPPPKKFGPDK